MERPIALWHCTDSRSSNMLDHQSVYQRKRLESVLIARVLTTSRGELSDTTKNITMRRKFPERKHVRTALPSENFLSYGIKLSLW
jgi:hypothetical protein